MHDHCEWCVTGAVVAWYDGLCDMHQAEYEGYSEDMIANRDRIQYEEYLESLT
jgi:hypothetical protein